MSSVYRIKEDSIQEKFFQCYKKIQIYAGGFGNGKTSAVSVRTLAIAKDYPGANILVARETYPKLNDTIRKEVLKWTPRAWVKKDPTDTNNNLVIQNGTTINFRYIAQQGKSTEQSSSNLLSANYDLIVIDQVEDPKITHKDFLDLLGRLRGSTPYKGDDPNMPRTGPRMIFLTANPSRNWVYHKLVKPYELWKKGIKHPDLLVDETGEPIIEIFEGSTLDNADNLPADFITGLKSAYQGQQYNRFVLGKWDAYEGLVYPEFDTVTHVIPDSEMRDFYKRLNRLAVPKWSSGYDHGIAVPSCYLQSFTDLAGNVHVCDGYYEAEKRVETWLAPNIRKLQNEWGIEDVRPTYADPQIFKRAGQVGDTIATTFANAQVQMVRGSNNIDAGIEKISSYLTVGLLHKHPYTGNYGSPRLFVSDKLTWLIDEFGDYMWKKDTSGEREDAPRDTKDHALDALKYKFTGHQKIAMVRPLVGRQNSIMTWREREVQDIDPRILSRRAS